MLTYDRLSEFLGGLFFVVFTGHTFYYADINDPLEGKVLFRNDILVGFTKPNCRNFIISANL